MRGMTLQQTILTPLTPSVDSRIGLSLDALVELCQKWGVKSIALFGSILREDFTSDSDIDFLVSFRSDARQGLIKQVKMKHELESIVNRKVDIVVRESVEESENWIRRHEILTTAQVIYEQR